MKSSAPTMKDVARVAGVALGTVSKVINGQPVGEAYKNKVDRAIDELGYKMNVYARGLKVSKSNAVALIIPDILNQFFATFAHYIELALYKQGYKLTLCCSNGQTAKEAEYLSLVQMNKVDGIIALTYGDVEKYVSSDIPLVTFDRQFISTSYPLVSSDNFSGGIIAAEKFIELGCTAPAFIRVHSPVRGEVDKRKDGFVFACEKHGITPIIVDVTDDSSHESAVMRLIDGYSSSDGGFQFDCVFCNTDLLAFTAKKLLCERGCRIPEDVQIIGFDGMRYFNSTDAPMYVSSIVQPIQLIAEKCVELVLCEDQSIVPTLTLLPVKFEYGGTTKQL